MTHGNTEWAAHWGIQKLQSEKGLGSAVLSGLVGKQEGFWNYVDMGLNPATRQPRNLETDQKTQSGQVLASCFTDTGTGPSCSAFCTESQAVRPLPTTQENEWMLFSLDANGYPLFLTAQEQSRPLKGSKVTSGFDKGLAHLQAPGRRPPPPDEALFPGSCFPGTLP